MKKIFLLIVALLFLTGCQIFPQSSFQKKQDCYKYKKDLIAEINAEGIGINSTYDKSSFKLSEIFYSKKKDTCIASIYYIITTTKGKETDTQKYQLIKDILTNTNIYLKNLKDDPLWQEYMNLYTELKSE